MGFVEHPLIKEKTIEKRKYQESIIKTASKKNSLVVLPTGIGKTLISVGVAAERLKQFPDYKILIMAPTKPLVEQHKKSFGEFLRTDKIIGVLEILTGKVPPAKREKCYKEQGIIFATPQAIQNDLLNNRLKLTDFSFITFDEAHRSIGNYAYTFIARKYMEESEHPLILGLTASPGATKEKIGKICGNLFVDNVEVRTEEDTDVREYIPPMQVEWVKVDLTDDFKRIRNCLRKALSKRESFLKKYGFVRRKTASKKELLELQRRIWKRLSEKKEPLLFHAISNTAACIKIKYALEILETQGISQLNDYLDKMQRDGETKAAKMILKDENIKQAVLLTKQLYNKKVEHPKLGKLKDILKEELTEDKKVIIFTHYVNSVDLICNIINKGKIKAIKFVGQRKGVTQKKQIEILNRFREGEFNVLVSSPVAEEGLDIPKVDLVILYEPIPSEIRTIQRKGRTARIKAGKVYILIAKGTIDEAYYWSSMHKEKKMKSILKEYQNKMGKGVEVGKKAQESLDKYSNREGNPIIYTDVRENGLIKELQEKAVIVRTKQLAVGDFLLSDRLVVERKTSEDFLQSMISGRLFKQLEEMASNFERPVLIIEGKEDLFSLRNIHPNAIRGALASIYIDYRIPVIWTKNMDETATVLFALAKREQKEVKREIQIKGEKKPVTLKDFQEKIISSFPNVNSVLGKRILEEFKTVKDFINSSEDKLQKVDGIGKEKSKRIKEIIEREYE